MTSVSTPKNQYEEAFFDLLDEGDYQTYNRSVARAVGSVNAAIMLSELINRYKCNQERGELVTFDKAPGEWFYYTLEKCEERTVLSRKEQDRAIKYLTDHGLVIKQSFGTPAKRHFQIKWSSICTTL